MINFGGWTINLNEWKGFTLCLSSWFSKELHRLWEWVRSHLQLRYHVFYLFFFPKPLWAFNELPSMWLQATRTPLPFPSTLNLLSNSAEEFGLHDDKLLWKLLLPPNLVVARSYRSMTGAAPGLFLTALTRVYPLTKFAAFKWAAHIFLNVYIEFHCISLLWFL